MISVLVEVVRVNEDLSDKNESKRMRAEEIEKFCNLSRKQIKNDS